MASGLAVLALAGAGFALGAALSPDDGATRTPTSVTTAAARPVINAPDSATQPPALARVKHHRKAKRAEPKATTTGPESGGQSSVAVNGTAAQQTPVQPSGGGSGTGTSTTKTQPTQKQTTTDTSTVEPPPFDEHTTSGQ